jgi:hypothetical protein
MTASKVVDTGDGWRGELGDTQTRGEGDCSVTVYPAPPVWCWTAICPSGDWYKSASGWNDTEAQAKTVAVAAAKGLR